MEAGGANLRSWAVSYCLSIPSKPLLPTHLGWVNSLWVTCTSCETRLQICVGLASFSGMWLVLVPGLVPFLWKLRAEHTPRWSLMPDWKRPGRWSFAAFAGCSVDALAVFLSLLWSLPHLRCSSSEAILALPASLSSLWVDPLTVPGYHPGWVLAQCQS